MDKSREKPARDAARAGALRLLAAVEEGATLDEAAAVIERLAPPDRARARRLALEVLRRQQRVQALLAPMLARRPRPEILRILQLATVEMLALGQAPHGVVNAAVGLTRGLGRQGQAAAGMVNAVLRKVPALAEAWAALPPQQMPDWLRAPVVAAWGEPAARAIEAAHEAGAPLDLTPRDEAAAAAMPGERLPTGSWRLDAGVQVSGLPGYAEGHWWVQDAAAALAVRLLAPQPGEAIADLCAAPGGKTLQLAAAGAQVTALDISAGRLQRVAENLARCGLSARLVAADALHWQPGQPLDAVLLDAPCSATGTIRRHPELPLIRDGGQLAELTALQARLIDHALDLLKPGGRLVYATCSLLPAEGEAQLQAALARHSGLLVETPAVPGVPPGWFGPEGGLRLRPDLWPERGGMDGFFIVRLRKPGPVT
ncbi:MULTISPECIES: RsmB/NOP family class I SAM-dependent RNA methyltransferase [unclassified Paracoccus (in: a-proteobacteria)]|uniref:RsmB/NOP family class I SAM-dependent RNA methyltransferase n=1 Tax=unclassified Paracoccus (in: a-proteobacteria) TaxID=2688777 RepID=UPI0021E19948|nr:MULTISPECIES: transcription antitermination factor NusB [unclassified Paracoccus (in: a-proteobacteria)]UXU75825.1 methyltransferase domain-containing protein [Paracoccus sp. SMMA_5]UXU81734.1 methyltransferase domain-containing protein [Paracoccus sp. SMMA_5_TC]